MEKYKRLLAAFLAILLLFPCQAALAAGAGERQRHDHIIICDDLRYGYVVSHNGQGRQSAHYLSFHPGGNIRPMVSAGGRVFGASNINTVIGHVQNQGHNVLGGINADFFSFQTGIPEGIYISDGQLRSSHQGRGAVFFQEDGSAFLGNPTLTFTLSNQGGPNSSNAGQRVDVLFYNKFRQPGWLFLLDEHFSATTRTTTPGREVFFRILGGDITVGGEVSLEVTNIVNSTGALNIPAGHILLSADQTSPHLGQLDRFAVGDLVTLRVGTSDVRAAQATWATGGGDILVSGGRHTTGWDASVGGAHPRTALGIRADGSVILYAIDGRIPGHSVGLTLRELADELISLGAVYVINLDGGGSTSFSYRMPGSSSTTILNRPSAGSLRNCATFILLTSLHRGGGEAAYIQFHPGHARVLGGSIVTPADLSSRITMTDRGYFPFDTAGLHFTSYSADHTLGHQEGSAFRTAAARTNGLLTAYGANGARGRLRLDLVDRPDSIDVRLAGNTIPALLLSAGDQISLSYHAIEGGRELIVSRDLYSTTVSPNIAYLDWNGTLTVTGRPGEQAMISISANGVTRTVPLLIANVFPDTQGHWAEGYIGRMREAGVVSGISTNQGTLFFPNRNVTRAEFAAMFSRLLGLDVNQYSLSGHEFVDHGAIPNWARSYVAAMFQRGYITGRTDPNGVRFDANSPITRAEAFTILGRLMTFYAPDHVLNRFSDQDQIPGWARAAIARLVYLDLLTGTGDGRLRPRNNLTRAEAATILARMDLSALHPTDLEAYAYPPESDYEYAPPEEDYNLPPEPDYDLPKPEENYPEEETDAEEADTYPAFD